MASAETKGMSPEYTSLAESLVALESDRMGIEAKTSATDELLGSIRGEMRKLPAKQRRLEELSRDQQVAERFYHLLVDRAQQLWVTSKNAMPSVTMTIIDSPRLPKGISDIGSPPYLIILIFGPILSILIGLTTVFIAEYFDDTFDGSKEAEELTFLPIVMATIPHMPKLKSGILPWLEDSVSERHV